jgi:hypothetical protein
VLTTYSIKDLYPLALAEGEGMGTAYEYYVKRLALERWLAGRPRPASVLIAGLPEKYGASLDFLLLAGELGAAVTVVDDRPAALERLGHALRVLARSPGAPRVAAPAEQILADLDHLSAITGHYDLALSSEVLQRLTPGGRAAYVARLAALAPARALFCPNADNDAHNSRSGLGGLRLEELRALMSGTDDRPQTTDHGLSSVVCRLSSNFIDLPPFPPGITRSAAQREEATTGRFESAVMSGLGRYASMERFLPQAVRRRQSHIVYAFAG